MAVDMNTEEAQGHDAEGVQSEVIARSALEELIKHRPHAVLLVPTTPHAHHAAPNPVSSHFQAFDISGESAFQGMLKLHDSLE